MIAAHTPFWWMGLALLGLGVGIIAGMFGVGGGFLLTPLLAVLFRVPLAVAVGTGMCQMIGVGVAALSRLRLPPYVQLPRSEQQVSTLVVAYLELATGFLSGLLGMGGGAILTPILIYGIGMRTRTAAGTGILVLVATSLVGTAVHAWNGHVHLGMAIMLLAGSTLGAQIGALLTSKTDGQKLRRVFVWLVLFTIAAVCWDLLRALLAA